MNIKNIQTVHSISESNSLAQVECVHEDLKTGYRKYEIFFINKNNQVVAFFENTEVFNVNKHLVCEIGTGSLRNLGKTI